MQRTPLARTLVLTLALAACGGPEDAEEISSLEMRRESVGDTVVLWFSGSPKLVTVDSVGVVWRSDRLGRPSTMALAGGRLVVGDGDRVHLLPPEGDTVITVGREGAGPGEFRSIWSVGALTPDTIAVYDVGNARLSFLSPAGDWLRVLALEGPTMTIVAATSSCPGVCSRRGRSSLPVAGDFWRTVRVSTRA